MTSPSHGSRSPLAVLRRLAHGNRPQTNQTNPNVDAMQQRQPRCRSRSTGANAKPKHAEQSGCHGTEQAQQQHGRRRRHHRHHRHHQHLTAEQTTCASQYCPVTFSLFAWKHVCSRCDETFCDGCLWRRHEGRRVCAMCSVAIRQENVGKQPQKVLVAPANYCKTHSSGTKPGQADDIQPVGPDALVEAAEAGDIAECTLLLDQGVNVNAVAPKASVAGTRALRAAVVYGRIELVQMLLARGADPNATNALGWAPAHEAANHGHLDILSHLLNAGCDINACTKNGDTPLAFAARRADASTVAFLLAKAPGIFLNTQNSDGWTALHRAAIDGRTDCVAALLKAGARVSLKTDRGATPLHAAALNGYFEIAMRLLNAGASVHAQDLKQMTPLHSAVSGGRLECVQVLLNHGANPLIKAEDGLTVLHLAAQRNFALGAKALLAAGADPLAQTRDGSTALHLCRDSSGVALVPLLAAAADICNNTGHTPVFRAAQQGDAPMLEALSKLDPGIDPLAVDQDGRSLCHLATLAGSKQCVSLCCRAGVDLNIKDSHGDTAAHLAAGLADASVLRHLISCRANMAIANDLGNTVAHAAVLAQRHAALELLVDQLPTSTLNILLHPNNLGDTPIHFAARWPRPTMLDLLLRDQRDLTATATDGSTPLHRAAFAGSAACVRRLIQSCPAALEMPDNAGKTPLLVACSQGQEIAVSVLLKRGASLDAMDERGRDAYACAVASGNAKAAALVERVKARHDASLGELPQKAAMSAY